MHCSIILLAVLLPIAYATTCTSNQYCPRGWAVKRVGKEYAAMTCQPNDPTRKCPKPYKCVASHCSMNFCCAHEKMLEQFKQEQEEQDEGDDGDEIDADEF